MLKKLTALILTAAMILTLAACSKSKRVDSLELSKRLEKIDGGFAFHNRDTYIVGNEHVVFLDIMQNNDALLSFETDRNNSITRIKLTIDAEVWDKANATKAFGEYSKAVLSAFTGCTLNEAQTLAEGIGLFDESAYFDMHEVQSEYNRYTLSLYSNPLCSVAEFVYSPALDEALESTDVTG